MSGPHRAGLGTAALAAVLLTGACGGSGTETPADASSASWSTQPGALSSTSTGPANAAEPGPTPELGGVLPPLESPLQAYQIRGADLYTIGQAESQLAGDCMRRFGFDQPPNQLNRDQIIAEQRVADTRLYGITDVGVARQYGYQPAPTPADDSSEPEMAQSDTYRYIFFGQKGELSFSPPPGGWKSPGKVGGVEIPAAGCLGEARTNLWGEPFFQAKDQLAGGLRLDAYQNATADPRVQAALQDWSACMAKSGFQYSSPLEVNFDRSKAASAPSPEEINGAVTDIGCKQKVDLVARWNRVDVEYQKKAIEENQLQLTEERDEIDAALARAAQVLGG